MKFNAFLIKVANTNIILCSILHLNDVVDGNTGGASVIFTPPYYHPYTLEQVVEEVAHLQPTGKKVNLIV